MNKLYPSAEMSSDEDAIEAFLTLIVNGFDNPENVEGRVLIEICGPTEYHEILQFNGPQLQRVEFKECDVFNAKICLPIGTVYQIFKNFHTLDWRDPKIIGTMTFEGDLGLVNQIGKSCLRPSDSVKNRFEAVEKLHASKNFSNFTEQMVRNLIDPSIREIMEIIELSEPAVIKYTSIAEKICSWNLEALEEKFAGSIVRVRSAENQQTMESFVNELRDFMKSQTDKIVEGFTKPYTEGAALPKAMYQDFGPVIFNRSDFMPPQLWLGAVPINVPTSSLHRDPLCGFLSQIFGRKKLELYSADQAKFLYPMKSYNNYQPCWFKPESPDYHLFPKAKKAKSISVEIGPGEILIQPAGWFHQVYALDSPNMSVSYFWKY